MENKLVSLKENFNKIMEIRSNIQEIFDILNVKITKLQNMHSEMIQVCKNQLFVFGLDSFNFQNKIIDIEYEDMMRYFLAINNRMYCEYFKLYRIVIDYIHKNTKDVKLMEVAKLNQFPPYKDLEPFKEYSMEILIELHESLLTLISSMISHIHHKDHELVMHETKKKIGINIDNFVTTFHYNISIMKEKIMLFIKYIEFFHVLHTKYMQRFSNKIQLMYAHINNDIHLDGNLNNTEELISASTPRQLQLDSIIKRNSLSGSHDSSRDIVSLPSSNQIIRNSSLSMSTDEIPSTPNKGGRSNPKTIAAPFLSKIGKTKSVNDILQESGVQLPSKTESSEDIAVYNVFSSIESKCTSIQPALDTLRVEDSSIMQTQSVDESVSSVVTIHGDPQKRRVRKKKSETS